MIESSRRNVQRSTLTVPRPNRRSLYRLSPRRTSMDLRSALDTSAATTILFALGHRRGSQVVRSRSAKPLFAGSIPAPAFFIGKNGKTFRFAFITKTDNQRTLVQNLRLLAMSFIPKV